MDNTKPTVDTFIHEENAIGDKGTVCGLTRDGRLTTSIVSMVTCPKCKRWG